MRDDLNTPDLVLLNGRILTVNEGFDTAEALSITSGRFGAVGTTSEIAAMAGPATTVIDLDGRTVVPGLIDSHMHLHWAALNAVGVQLLDARSIADVQALVAERARITPPGGWIIGSSGWHESLLAEGRLPTRRELDDAAPDHPVFIPRGGHVCSANSTALALAGIGADTPDPDGGVIVRDPETGEPTGVLLETASGRVRRVLPPPPGKEEQARLLADMMRQLNAFGLVSVAEPGLDEPKIAVYEALRASGDLTIRTDIMYRANNLTETRHGLGLTSFDGDDMLRFTGLKYMLDGGVEGGRLHEPYRIVPGEQHDPDYHGVYLLPPGGEDEFVEALKLVARQGQQVQCHGVGDAAIDLIVRAYSRVNEEIPIRDLRWTVMHVHVPTPQAIRTMAEIGIMATVQDHSVLLGPNMVRWWGEERAAYCTPIRLLIDSGLHVGGGTDGPILPVDPFISMWWMVTRRTLKGDVLGPEHAITAREALELYTINNAVIMGVEDERGSIEPGKRADLAVLSQDILSVPPEAIRDTKALLTLLGGRIVHRDGI